MYLRNGRLDIDWTRKASEPYFERVRTVSRDVAGVLGGTLRRQPAVVPAAGDHRAPARRRADGPRPRRGRRGRYGNVFGHPGLHIADGSVMPGPDRPQPKLHDRGAGRPLRRPDHRSRPTRRGGGGQMTSTVRFTEEMLGHVTFGETDFARGAQPRPRRLGGVQVPPHDRGRRTSTASPHDPLRPAVATGWVHCDALGGRLPVVAGLVQPVRRRGTRASSTCSTGCGSTTASATR